MSLEALTAYGYSGLFLASFAAATILPLSSEIVLSALLAQGFSPSAAVLTATAGNVLGSTVNYTAGFLGNRMIFARWFHIPEDKIQAAQKRYQTYGNAGLLFAWVPVIGDPLTFVAGMLKTNFSLFLLLVTAGKSLRYIVITFFF